jgi:hypothetical protein
VQFVCSALQNVLARHEDGDRPVRAPRLGGCPGEGGPPNPHKRGGTQDEAEDEGGCDENPRLYAVCFLVSTQSRSMGIGMHSDGRPRRSDCSNALHRLLFTNMYPTLASRMSQTSRKATTPAQRVVFHQQDGA